jgi:hypothetical protein
MATNKKQDDKKSNWPEPDQFDMEQKRKQKQKVSEDDGGTCSSAIATGPAQNLLAQPQKRVKETTKMKKTVKEAELLPTKSAVLHGIRVAEGVDPETNEKKKADVKKAAEKLAAKKKEKTNEGRNHLCGKFEKDGKKFHLWNDGEYQYSLTTNAGMNGPQKIKRWTDASIESVQAELSKSGFQDMSGDLGEGQIDEYSIGAHQRYQAAANRSREAATDKANQTNVFDPKVVDKMGNRAERTIKSMNKVQRMQQAQPTQEGKYDGFKDAPLDKDYEYRIHRKGSQYNSEWENHPDDRYHSVDDAKRVSGNMRKGTNAQTKITRHPREKMAGPIGKLPEGLGDDFANMARGMKNKDGTPRFTTVRQGPAPRKPESTATPVAPRKVEKDVTPAASGPADWYNQSSGGKRNMGDSKINRKAPVEEAFKEVPTHSKSGKPNANHPSFAKHDAEFKAQKQAMKAPRAPAKPKLTLNDVWRKVEDVVGQVFPDGDPIDWMIPWFQRQGIDGHKIGEYIARAARANGYKDMYDYWDQLKAQMDADAAYDAGQH